jgi:hypothetical protein
VTPPFGNFPAKRSERADLAACSRWDPSVMRAHHLKRRLLNALAVEV